jgi:hypothetical protein
LSSSGFLGFGRSRTGLERAPKVRGQAGSGAGATAKKSGLFNSVGKTLEVGERRGGPRFDDDEHESLYILVFIRSI